MKIRTSFILIPVIMMAIVFFTFIVSGKLQHPEKLIIGTWEEVSWNYAKVDSKSKGDSLSEDFIEEVLKNEISKDLVIHQAERWTFKSDSQLILHKENQDDINVRWRLKGRGHILKLIYDDHETIELYKIKELDKDKLILHFENDVHARGIIKIEFNRKK